MINLWRIIIFGTQNFWRNIWLSLVTVLIVILNLSLMTMIMGLNVVGQQTLTAVKSKVNLSVYFTASTAIQKVEDVRSQFLKRADVNTIAVITAEQHLKDLEKSPANNDHSVEKAVEQLGGNPLGPGMIITAKTLEEYAAISKALKDPSLAAIIESTGNDYQSNAQVIERLSNIVKRVQQATWWLTGMLALIMVLMIFNTIRVTIYSQREEIGIMKLVGASDAFVRGPFLVTSFLYGLLASVLVVAVLLPVLSILNPFFTQFFAGYDINIVGYTQQHIWLILGLEVLVACGLSMVSSVAAIGRYLRV